MFYLGRPWCLVDHAAVHFLLCKVPSAPEVVHVLEVHHLEGVFIGTAATHHGGDLAIELVNKMPK